MDWLQNHGEVFLRKNVGIGRNLQKARAYQKSHETFEGVVQVRKDIVFRFSDRTENQFSPIKVLLNLKTWLNLSTMNIYT